MAVCDVLKVLGIHSSCQLGKLCVCCKIQEALLVFVEGALHGTNEAKEDAAGSPRHASRLPPEQ